MFWTVASAFFRCSSRRFNRNDSFKYEINLYLSFSKIRLFVYPLNQKLFRITHTVGATNTKIVIKIQKRTPGILIPLNCDLFALANIILGHISIWKAKHPSIVLMKSFTALGPCSINVILRAVIISHLICDFFIQWNNTFLLSKLF